MGHQSLVALPSSIVEPASSECAGNSKVPRRRGREEGKPGQWDANAEPGGPTPGGQDLGFKAEVERRA